jgi:formiminotetrahydrofolate cyclodeaminase
LKHSPRPSILDQSVGGLLNALGSSAPTPGGGAAAALTGALGAALVQMTANLTIGRPRLADVQEHAQQIEARAAGQRDRLAQLADADAEAYAAVSTAYKLPRETDEQRTARARAIQVALDRAARVPLETAEACAAVLALSEEAAPVLNKAVISDVMTGALLALAGLEAAVVNVQVNLASMTDAASVERFTEALERARGGAKERTERVQAVGRSRMQG